MTPEEMRVAIAEAMGFEWCRIGTEERPHRMLCIMHPVYTRADMTEPVCNPAYMWEHGRVPNYPADLNAMHEAWLLLSLQQRNLFQVKLRRIVLQDPARDLGELSWVDESKVCNATAAQRAEAFCRVLYPERFNK